MAYLKRGPQARRHRGQRARPVDPVQFDQRRWASEFDMLQNRWDQSLSPGNEQSSTGAARPPTFPARRNYMGAKEPAIDALIAALLEARERPAFSLLCVRSTAS